MRKGGAGSLRVPEKGIVLPIALRVAELLRAQGANVNLTRTGDVTLGLYERDLSAEAAGSDLLVGGDVLPASLARRWFELGLGERCALINAYGPTEATISSHYHRVLAGDSARPVPLGRLLPGRVAAVLDSHGRIAARGVPMVLANARLSEKSLRGAQRAGLLLRPAYRALTAAWAQSEADAARLRAAHPGLEVVLVPMSTRGDEVLDRSLAAIGGKGLFLKELELAMRRG